ncbi:MAG: hypothetical protein H0Z19_05985 [Archaeoglobus sp.]|uniref:hypothetical protein n=1 Tax=Archaeoglobus sp. TaxID=1872626 RepID=UPI001D99B775|nr:hypothetical protein [Archaeoglobus sp.]MBO8180018.1 hypothetical protein [Archaeoglobus sp.]
MAVSIEEFSRIIIATLDLNFEILKNFFTLLVVSSTNTSLVSEGANLNFSNVWGLIYGGLVSNYWNSFAIQEVLNATQHNVSAMKNFSIAINYLGSNATTVFGDPDGTKGLTYLQKGVYDYLKNNPQETEKLADSLAGMFKAQVEFLIKLMESVNTTFT